MKKKIVFKSLLKVVIFSIIFSILLTAVTTVLTVKMCPRSYNSIKDFYREEKNSADAVYIGSSNALTYWNPMFAWEEYGITVPTFACNAMPLASLEYFLKEAHRTQPDAVYILNINTLNEKGKTDIVKKHRIFAYTPFSINKVEGLARFFNFYDIPLGDMPEYCFPIIRFHSNWSNITYEDFLLEPNGFRGSDVTSRYMKTLKDCSDKYIIHDKYVDISPDLEDYVNHMLDYCDKENLKVVFVTVPQAQSKTAIGKYNTINKIISDRGYTALDLMNDIQEMDFSPAKDFYNGHHANVHGSRKFTYYMAEYLIDNFGFTDKRKDENYSDWNTSLSEYMEIANSAVLDFELDSEYKSSNLSVPTKLEATASGDSITVTYNAVDGSEGYVVYERLGFDGHWKKIGETTATSFVDKDFKKKSEYYYRVVPFRTIDGKKTYGDFSYRGAYVATN